MTARAAGPGFWATVLLLLVYARKRATGRRQRHVKLRYRRGGRSAAIWPMLGTGLGVIFATILHVGGAFDVELAARTAERVQAEARGRLVVEEWFAGRIENYEADAAKNPALRDAITRAEQREITIESARLARQDHGDQRTIRIRLASIVHDNPKALLSEDSLWWQPGALPDLAALIIVSWWALMLVCQGEGPELDAQRSRDPMWEWLFSHPAPPAAIFLAEMIAPIAANSVYSTAPLFPGVLFGMAYGWPAGLAATLLVGVPVAIALACIGKAIEIRILLRLPPRTRGTALGLMGWFGFTSMMFFLFIISSARTLVPAVIGDLAPFADLPWPPVRMLLGRTFDGHYVFWQGLLLCWLLATVLVAGAVAFSVASTRRGLAYQSASRVAPTSVSASSWFASNPLYRKELLWFRRDGSALVQAVLLPLSLAALQAFNMRGLIADAVGAWNTVCGMAILFGTYFLLILGPKSLASEGQALWIAQTWPHGLENLLKAKARLWSLIATAIVGVVLIYAGWRFPRDLVSILIVGAAWWVFARSLADKTVTLATVTSASGEVEKLPVGLRWAAVLGTLTFAVGIMTRQWSLAAAGIVYSFLTAAAMWQNFRYRLPFLSDPWSEQLPPPPTLLHAMVAISAMVEGVSVLSALSLWVVGREHLAPVVASLYGICAICAAVGVSYFLGGRGVSQRDIWLWRDAKWEPAARPGLDSKLHAIIVVAAGAALGATLGLVAHLYLWALQWWPDAARALDESRRQMDQLPDARLAYFVLAVLLAPFAEEFLFRGLLYRALDREWPGWRAIVGSGAFFAVYHPALSWPPVAMLGILNALLFKRTGRLPTAIAAHMAYNAVVLAF